MTYADISTLAESIGLPFAYYQFEDGTGIAPPFLVFMIGYDDFYADDSNYQRIAEVTFELYTDYKDFVLEDRVADALTAAGLTFTQDETFIDSERMHLTTFGFETLLTR